MRAIASKIKPPPKLTVSEWADKYRRLSPEASAEPGQWKTARAEYQRGIMDAVSDPDVESVVVMSCAQVGKTEIINNMVGYHISQDPAPLLIVQPSLEMAQTWSKDRLSTMIRDTPALNALIKDPRSRDSGNTTLHKLFPGGHVTCVGANSPAGLASRPCRVVLFDEVDRYPPSAGSEGDPVNLGKRRAATFWNRKFIMVSTPTIKDISRIEAAYEESDQREYRVPCKDCGEYEALSWQNVHWESNMPDTAHYTCGHCGSVWDDTDRMRAIAKGKWVATKPFNKVAGFRLNGLNSPWLKLEDAVYDFLEARKMPETLKTWVNTFLGETFVETGSGMDDQVLSMRKEKYDMPDEVVIITAGVDCQDDRLEIEILGHGKDNETWSIDYKILYGDPSGLLLWSQLDDLLQSKWDHNIRGKIGITATCIDSGGHHTQAVYAYCKQRERERIYAIKGVGGEGKPIVGRPSTNNIGKVKLFPVGVDTAKELIYSRLQIEDPGPGYCHFPEHYDDEYFKQLTAEQIFIKAHKGYKKREWRKVRPRNEALDCRVYAISALSILNTNVNMLAERPVKSAPVAEEPEKFDSRTLRRKARPRRTDFVNSWRN